jgi:hypothetical protein
MIKEYRLTRCFLIDVWFALVVASSAMLFYRTLRSGQSNQRVQTVGLTWAFQSLIAYVSWMWSFQAFDRVGVAVAPGKGEAARRDMSKAVQG